MSQLPGLAAVLVTAAALCTTTGRSVSLAETQDGQAGNSVSQRAPTFAEVKSIFESRCATCHNPDEKAANLSLVGDNTAANLVGVPSSEAPTVNLIEPLQPARSYLLLKIEGTHVQAGGQGLPMPPEGRLSAEEIAVIRDWIVAGASV
jgi:mono/diheme cytochrome c family protein